MSMASITSLILEYLVIEVGYHEADKVVNHGPRPWRDIFYLHHGPSWSSGSITEATGISPEMLAVREILRHLLQTDGTASKDLHDEINCIIEHLPLSFKFAQT